MASSKTMAQFDPSPAADPHPNGTIWAAALWDLRTWLGAQITDVLVIKALLLIGRLSEPGREKTVTAVRHLRETYAAGLAAVLEADEELNSGRNRETILRSFGRRGICPRQEFHGSHASLEVSSVRHS